MEVEVILPKFGWTMEEALISDWLKEVGERVEEDEPLFVIETDKANQDVPAPASGMLREILFPAGETVPVGEVIAYITAEEAKLEPAPTSDEPAPVPDTPPNEPLQPAEVIHLAGMRKVIAARMTASLRDSAQLTLTTEVDLTESEEKRAESISRTAIVVQIAARVLAAHPLINSLLRGEEIHIWAQRNIGVAVALAEGGLIVPVVSQADAKSVVQLSEEIADLSEAARTGALPAEALADGTFTVTNLGMYGIDAFTPIVDPPQTAILGVGRWLEKPAMFGAQMVPRILATLSLTIDHRIVDGVPGAAFLKEVCTRLAAGDYS